MKKLFIAALAVASVASPVLAADLILDVAEVQPVVTSGPLAGYIEVGVGGGISNYETDYFGELDYTDEWTEVLLSGAGRVAIPIAPRLALQIDTWLRKAAQKGTYCDVGCDPWEGHEYRAGTGAHLAYALDGAVIGALVTVGTRGTEYGHQIWMTGAVEGSVSFDRFRLFGQVGASNAISGDIPDSASSVFAQGVLAYYIDPNLKISGGAGVDSATYENSGGEAEERSANWSLGIEKKFEDMPFSLFAVYQGTALDGSDNVFSEWRGTSHAFKVGARFAFGEGTETLQDLDNTVGLKDMNPVYGDY